MESLASLMATLVMVLIMAVPLAFIYRHRSAIKQWISDKEYKPFHMWRQDCIKQAERDVIKAEWELEDARDFLVYKQAEKAKKDAGEG